MSSQQQRSLSRDTGCDIRFDNHTRQLFATDASIYQIEPYGVAFPKSPDEASAVIQAAAADGIAVIPRGAGTGLAGGAIGSGLVIDSSRYNREISKFDPEKRTVYVEAGVVLDQLNAFLKPHGLRFGPDVATSSRATLGGMIANNSSGSHAPLYGTTIDHVVSVDVVLADGRQATVGADAPELAAWRERIGALLERHRGEIDVRMPEGLVKRWPGYGIDRWVRQRADLSRLLGGSEGTLAVIAGATLALSPLPKRRGLGAVCFASVAEAMQATVDLQALKPAAIEHIDRLLFDQTKGQLAFKRARALLELDEKPCEAILLVEFFDDIDAPLKELAQRNLGLRIRTFSDAEDMQAIWELRKAGLSLLTGRIGPAKPTAGIEDACVRPEHLPEYVAGLRGLMEPLGLEGSFYGHAASGLLHVRPVVDLHSAADLRRFRQLADEVSALVRQFKGSIAGEHGVGIARTEYVEEHLGPELVGVLREIKALFDPDGRMNPGKVIPDGDFRIDTNLRWGAGYEVRPPFEPALAFAFKDGSFVGNLEQCNGVGACRKDAPTMCPTYQATGEEIMSTRGRANTIRAAYDGRLNGGAAYSPELEAALGPCLSCKACTTECPSNVNMALLKTEILHAKHQAEGLPLRDRMLSRVDLLGSLGGLFPRANNLMLRARPVRRAMERTLGLAAERPLPLFAGERFDRWFAKRKPPGQAGQRGRVVLWDDCFTRYYEPEIGRAAVRVLEAAGYAVVLPENRACCGRPAFSLGRIDLARAWAKYNVELLEAIGADLPVITLEPSCFSMLWDDYRELSVDGAVALRERTALFEQFVADLLDREPEALMFRSLGGPIAVHAHCHAKSLVDMSVATSLLSRIPESAPTLLNTACCGMAGAFGAMREKYDLSMRLGALLAEQVNAQPEYARVVASGTSCRQQIAHCTNRTAAHIAEVLAEALGPEA